MSHRIGALLTAACFILLAVSTRALGEPPPATGPVANDPAALNLPVSPGLDRSAAGPAAEEQRRTQDGEDEIADSERGSEASLKPTGEEEKALGVPNGMFSARPADASEPIDGGFLTNLDPARNGVVRVSLALAAVIVLLLILRSLLRRGGRLLTGGSSPSGVVEILARYPVARRQHLVLLKLGRRVVLLHQGGGGMTALTSITDPDEVAQLLASMEAGARQKEAMRFRSILKAFEREHASKARRSSGAIGSGGNSADEVIDLTGGPLRGVGGWLSRLRSTA